MCESGRNRKREEGTQVNRQARKINTTVGMFEVGERVTDCDDKVRNCDNRQDRQRTIQLDNIKTGRCTKCENAVTRKRTKCDGVTWQQVIDARGRDAIQVAGYKWLDA